MLNDAKYIGLDVHQATISVVVLDGTGVCGGSTPGFISNDDRLVL